MIECWTSQNIFPIETQIHIGSLGARLTSLLSELKPSATILLADSNTAHHCLPLLRAECPALDSAELISIPAGEEHKSIHTLSSVWEQLLAFRCDRKALLICLGGGVVTDLGAFAAACFKRGIRFILVPTSLLAQVDAAIGSKTGIDFGGLKNSIGSFSPAEAVLVDHRFLHSLPPRELRSGLAEMFKHALIDDPKHWESLSSLPDDISRDARLPSLIGKSIAVKTRIVASDPFERGPREALNLGHSIGHAIESLLLETPRQVTHGEAVAAGIIAELYLAEHHFALDPSLVEQVQSTLDRFFPRIPLFASEIETLLALMAQDKKNRGKELKMALLSRIGQVRTGVSVSVGEVEKALRRYMA